MIQHFRENPGVCMMTLGALAAVVWAFVLEVYFPYVPLPVLQYQLICVVQGQPEATIFHSSGQFWRDGQIWGNNRGDTYTQAPGELCFTHQVP